MRQSLARMCLCRLDKVVSSAPSLERYPWLTCTHAVQVNELIEESWTPPVVVSGHHKRLEMLFFILILLV
jgi:hypothetical protein